MRKKRSLFLVDDGWHFEKREILLRLRDRLDFDVVTHDDLTAAMLGRDLPVRKIARFPVKKNPLYPLAMFFARPLDTATVRTIEELKQQSRPPVLRFLHRLHGLAGKLRLQRYSYCGALEWLYRGSRRYDGVLEGYDSLLFVPVAVTDKRIIYEARKAGLKIVCWVYSWDNPFKDNEFMADADHYLVWNEENARDLGRLHRIPREKIEIVGPVQFDYLLRTAAPPPGRRSERYVLYTCSHGQDCYVRQEVAFILNIRRLLNEIDPGLLLVVRPYPFRMSQEAYGSLAGEGGIELRHFGTVRENRILISRKDLEEKYDQLDGAECVINFGSTIGLEASFTSTPIIQLAYNYPYAGPGAENAIRLLENDHLAYMIDSRYPNIVTGEEALKLAMEEILSGGREKYMEYSAMLQRFARPLEVESFQAVFADVLRNILQE